MKRFIAAIVILAAISLLLACSQSNSGPPANLQNNFRPPAEIDPTQSKQAPDSFRATLVGKIDEKYAVQMDLERDGEKLKGTYFYDRPGASSVASKYISLEGTIDSQGAAVLTETVFDNERNAEVKTGEFKGKLGLATIDGQPGLRFAGTWTRARDGAMMAFSLIEKRASVGQSLRLINKKATDENKSLRYGIETNLPQLEGADSDRAAKFNATVNAFVAKDIRSFKKFVDEESRSPAVKERVEQGDAPKNSLEIGHSVTASDKDFISILFTAYSYTGGAHPNAATEALNYDLNRGARINLADLFTPGSNYLKLISDYAVAELNKTKVGDRDWIKQGAAPKSENYKSWNITPGGLMITFDAYQVASYAEGPQEVIVPYSILKPVIKPDGLLARFVK